MIFLSKVGKFRVVLTPATLEYVKVVGTDGLKPIKIAGKTVEFQELSGQGGRGGMFPGLGSDKRGYRGMHDTEDVEEINALLAHRAYGTQFIGLGGDGEGLVDPDDQFVSLSTKNGKQQWLCLLNGKRFKSTTAMVNHKKSASFQQLLEEKGLAIQESLDTI